MLFSVISGVAGWNASPHHYPRGIWTRKPESLTCQRIARTWKSRDNLIRTHFFCLVFPKPTDQAVYPTFFYLFPSTIELLSALSRMKKRWKTSWILNGKAISLRATIWTRVFPTCFCFEGRDLAHVYIWKQNSHFTNFPNTYILIPNTTKRQPTTFEFIFSRLTSRQPSGNCVRTRLFTK